MTLKKTLAKAFDMLQDMDIRAIKKNVDAIEFALYAIREAYNMAEEIEEEREQAAEKAGEENHGQV